MYFEPPKQLQSTSACASQRSNNALPVARSIILCITVTLLTGCVTTINHCGNESRDWNNLSFPKENYCSVPAGLPFAKQYEQANRAVCKVHDNNSGIWSDISQSAADRRFLCDYIKRSEFPWGVRHVTGYLSYFALRAISITRAEPGSAQIPESESNSVDGQLRDFSKNPIHDSNGAAIKIGK